MANYDKLRLHIQNYIKGNGNREITGFLLQDVLLSMVDTLGDDIIKLSGASCELAHNSELLGGHPASYFAVATDLNNLASTFKDMFYFTEDGKSIGTKYNFFSELEISAKGVGQDTEESGGSSTLEGLLDVTLSSPASGNILVYNGTHWVNKPQSELVPDIDLSDYYTRTEVDTKLGAYIKTTDADTKYAPLSGFNTLKSDFDALNAALNDDVSGKINTWNEIVDFVNEYNGSEDLATIISGINAEVNKRLLISTYNDFLANEYDPLKTKVGTIEGNVDDHNTRITANATDITALKARKVTAGNGLTGGGTLVADITLNIASANDGVTVNADNIQLNTINNLTTESATKPLSASQGKALSERIAVFENMFAFVDGNIKTTYNFYSTKEISAKGIGQETEESGGSGIINSVLGVNELGTALTDSDKVVFNAFATNKVYNDLVALASRVDNLATTTSAVGWKGEITSGKKIGTLTINGLENYLYAPATYAFSEITGKPTTLGGYGITDAFKSYGSSGAVDLNTVKTNGSYLVSGTASNSPSSYGQLICSRNSDTMAQIYIHWAVTSEAMRFRGGNDANGYYAWRTVLDNANYSNYALPSTGGTINTSSRAWGLVINTENSTGSYNRFHINNVEKATVGYYSDLAYIANEKTSYRIGVNDDGTPVYRLGSASASSQYTLLHSGNYSQYALPLSGGTVKSADTAALTIDTSDATMNSLLVRLGGALKARLVYHTTYGAFLANDTVGYRLGIDNSGVPFYFDGSNKTILHSGNIGDVNGIFLNRGTLTSNDDLNTLVKTGTFSTQTTANQPSHFAEWYGDMINIRFHDSTNWQLFATNTLRTELFFRKQAAGSWSDWKTIAFTDSNVASATKLATARTIWGQSFDGTGNVSGNLKVGDGYIYLNNNKGLYSYGTDGVATYVAGLDSSNNYLFGHGQYHSKIRGTSVSLTYGTSHATGLTLNSSGNVGIGTTSPSYKLDVAGSVRVGNNVDGGMLLRFNMDRSWDFYQQGTGADSTLALKSTTNSKNFVIQDETGGYIARFFAASTNSSVQIYTPLNVNGSTKVNADMYAAGSFYFATNSDYGGYLAANPEGWFGIYSAKKGSRQATNICCYPNGEVGLPHGAKITGKNPNGDTTLRVEGTQYTLQFGISSGNVNRGIYDVTNGAWWIYRDASTLTRISGGISTSTGAFSGAVTISNTLNISSSVGQGQVVTITDSSALSSFGRAFTALYPNAVKGAHIDMYVGVANSAKNGGYLGFYYDAAASDNNRISLGLYAKDNVLNINGKGHVLINTTVDSGNELEVNGKAYANNIYGGNSIYAKNYLFMNYDNSGIYLSTSSISWHSGNSYKSSLLEFTQTSVKISQPLSAGATTLSSLTVSGLLTASSGIKIGSATLSWDSTAGALKVDKPLYSTEEISAKGTAEESETQYGPLQLSANPATGTKTDSELADIGLTADAIDGLLSGIYTKVVRRINASYSIAWDYEAHRTSIQGTTIYLRGAMLSYKYSKGTSATSWTVTLIS